MSNFDQPKSIFQKFSNDLKDISGSLFGTRSLKPGEEMHTSTLRPIVEIGGPRVASPSASQAVVILSQYNNPRIKFTFQLMEGHYPYFINNGDDPITINSSLPFEKAPDGKVTINNGENIKLPRHDGATYSAELPNLDGSTTTLQFQNKRDISSGKIVTSITQLQI